MVDGRAPPVHWGMRPRYIFFRWLEEEEQWVVLLAVDEDVYYSQGSCDPFSIDQSRVCEEKLMNPEAGLRRWRASAPGTLAPSNKSKHASNPILPVLIG